MRIDNSFNCEIYSVMRAMECHANHWSSSIPVRTKLVKLVDPNYQDFQDTTCTQHDCKIKQGNSTGRHIGKASPSEQRQSPIESNPL